MALTLTMTVKMDCDKDQLKMIIITDSKWVATNLGSMSAFFLPSRIIHTVCFLFFLAQKYGVFMAV